MKKLFLLFIFFNVNHLTIKALSHEKLKCEKLTRCYDTKTKTFRNSKDDEKGQYVAGDPNSKNSDLQKDHCLCGESEMNQSKKTKRSKSKT